MYFLSDLIWYSLCWFFIIMSLLSGFIRFKWFLRLLKYYVIEGMCLCRLHFKNVTWPSCGMVLLGKYTLSQCRQCLFWKLCFIFHCTHMGETNFSGIHWANMMQMVSFSLMGWMRKLTRTLESLQRRDANCQETLLAVMSPSLWQNVCLFSYVSQLASCLAILVSCQSIQNDE